MAHEIHFILENMPIKFGLVPFLKSKIGVNSNKHEGAYGMKDTLTIDILMENTVGQKHARTCRSEWGLSLLIHWKNHHILLDGGPSGLFMENARHMQADLSSVTEVSLSHFHWDHADGLEFFDPPADTKLYAHPGLLSKIPAELKGLLEDKYTLKLSDHPVDMGEGIFFLGEIPRQTPFEKGCHKDDPMKDDSALALKTDKGCIVITGCSHSGIANICLQAQAVTGQPLRGVIGGMHLFDDNRETVEQTVAWFEEKEMEFFYPMHCIDFPTLKYMSDRLPVKVFHTGDTITVQG